MNSLLSIFVCLAMLLSGAYTAEDAASASRVATIHDVVVTLNGEEYALPQTLRLGVSAQDNAALWDVSMTSGDQTLFPAQLRMDDAGLALLLDLPEAYGSSTAYVFSTEYLDQLMEEMDMPEGFTELMSSYCSLLAKAGQLADKSVDPELAEQLTNYMLDLADDALVSEKTSLTRDGAEVPAVRTVFSLDGAQLGQLEDYEMELLDPEIAPLYFEFLNAAMAMSGEEDLPAMDSFADLFDFSGIDMRMDFDLTFAESGAGEGTITVVVTVEDETVELPMEITLQDADTGEVRMEYAEDGINLTMNYLVDGSQMDMDFTVNADEVSMGLSISETLNEGDGASSMNLSVLADDVSMNFGLIKTVDGDCGSAEIAFDLSSEGEFYGLSLVVDTAPEVLVDRIADADQVVIRSEEDMNSAMDGLTLNAGYWSGYILTLAHDESVSALAEAFSNLAAEDDFELFPDDGSYDDSYDDPDDLSFQIPEFSWLPEGYELTNTSVWSSLDNATLYFEYTGDDDAYHSTLCVDLYGAEEMTEYLLDADGSLSAIDQPVLRFSDANDEINAQCRVNGLDIQITYYDTDLTIDDIVSLINGMVTAH